MIQTSQHGTYYTGSERKVLSDLNVFIYKIFLFQCLIAFPFQAVSCLVNMAAFQRKHYKAPAARFAWSRSLFCKYDLMHSMVIDFFVGRYIVRMFLGPLLIQLFPRLLFYFWWFLLPPCAFSAWVHYHYALMQHLFIYSWPVKTEMNPK